MIVPTLVTLLKESRMLKYTRLGILFYRFLTFRNVPNQDGTQTSIMSGLETSWTTGSTLTSRLVSWMTWISGLGTTLVNILKTTLWIFSLFAPYSTFLIKCYLFKYSYPYLKFSVRWNFLLNNFFNLFVFWNIFLYWFDYIFFNWNSRPVNMDLSCWGWKWNTLNRFRTWFNCSFLNLGNFFTNFLHLKNTSF